MDDRIPTKPGRMKITPEDGSPAYYATVEMADEPTQVGTALNKENLLSDPVAMAVGLTASAVPDDMFDVMAHAGDLHVWRRTVETFEKIPAKYSLGPTQGKTPLTYPKTPTTQATFHYGKSISIDDNGEITINGEQTVRLNSDDSSVSKANNLKGSFFYCDSSTTIGADNGFETGPGNVYFIPSDAIISREPDSYLSGVLYTSKYQKVYTTPAVPPGTYIDYPVSVNPNAYQAGSDAKPAGYVLGEVVTGKTTISMTYNRCRITYCSAIEVNNNGTISPAPNSGGVNIPTNNMDSDDLSALKGKFFHTENSENDSDQIGFFSDPNYWAYIPEDAVITMETHPVGSPAIYITKYQPVTGYPAIPAGTTIEYIGKLGDKSRMQVVSYVGTGTYGSGNKTVVSFYFAPSIIFIFGYAKSNNVDFGVFVNGFSVSSAFLLDTNVNSIYLKTNNFTLDSGELSFYNIGDARSQLNAKGKKYTAIGFA